MNQDLTDDTYKASKDPRIIALAQITDVASREAAAADLDAAGLVIDREIDIYQWDPVKVMALRVSLGYPWVPNAFQPNLVDPLKTGVVPAGATATDMSKPWPRSIDVSLDSEDYKPIAAAPPPLPVIRPVGALVGNGIYGANLNACFVNGAWLFQDGQDYTQDGVKYVFHKTSFWGIWLINWTVAP